MTNLATTPAPSERGLTLITGATGGLGHALARAFARHGAPLLLVGRNASKLDEIARSLRAEYAVQVTTCVCDLASEAATLDLFAEVRRRGLKVHTLVNNAGVGEIGDFTSSSPVETFTVNLTAPLRLMREFLPGMIARDEGGILNVASIAGLVPVPYLAAYSASKAALISMSKSLAVETAATNVRVVVASPGPIATEFLNRSGLTGWSALKLYPTMDANLAAEAIYEGYLAGNRSIVPGYFAFLASLGASILPHRLATWLLGKMLAPRGPAGKAVPPSDAGAIE